MPMPLSTTSIRQSPSRFRAAIRIPPLVGVADRVGHEVLDHALEQAGIGLDR